MNILSKVSACGVILGFSHLANATTGTVMSGYGPKNITMGGASIAVPYDALASANNPAGMAKVGSRLDIELRAFTAKIDNSLGDDGNRFKNNVHKFFPELGANYQLDSKTSIGVSIYGSGVGALYKRPIAPIPGLSNFEAALTQVTLAPTVTRKFGDSMYVGVAPTFSYSTVKVRGIPGIPDGDDSSTGWGWRAGALWDVNESLSLAVMYSPRTRMGSWKKYRDNVFASSDARLDIVEQFGIGVAWRPARDMLVALDYLKLTWSDVAFLNTVGGIGYRDQKVWRAGIAYDLSSRLAMRAGYSYADNIYDAKFTTGLFNGPAISNRSIGIGASYKLNDAYELVGGMERHIPASLRGQGASTGTNLNVNYLYLVAGVSRRF